jgi:hypothetical protein
VSEIEELRARIAALEDAAKPKAVFVPPVMERFDPTAGMAMPRSVLAAMVEAAPVGDIVGDARRSAEWGPRQGERDGRCSGHGMGGASAGGAATRARGD